MAFEINATSPPTGGAPKGKGYHFNLPRASGTDGQGNPVGAVGYPSVTLNFERITGAVWDWYKDFTEDALSVALTELQVVTHGYN
jgi:hypothetical protein